MIFVYTYTHLNEEDLFCDVKLFTDHFSGRAYIEWLQMHHDERYERAVFVTKQVHLVNRQLVQRVCQLYLGDVEIMPRLKLKHF